MRSRILRDGTKLAPKAGGTALRLSPPSPDAVPFSIFSPAPRLASGVPAGARRWARGVFAVGLACAAAACNRTPPEPTPAPSSGIEVRSRPSRPSAPTARCVAPLGSSAPAIPPPAMSCPSDPEPKAELPTAELSFPDAPAAPTVRVELAKTPADIERGLMFRRSMPDDHGMLFTLDGRREQVFWMRNTCIPLDMLFIDEDGVIVGIVESATPLTETPRSVRCPSLYVLELNAGLSRKHGIAPGQRVSIPSAATR